MLATLRTIVDALAEVVVDGILIDVMRLGFTAGKVGGGAAVGIGAAHACLETMISISTMNAPKLE